MTINSTKNELTIRSGESDLLTKEQVDFNKLIERIRNAEMKLEAERGKLNLLLADCINKVYPLHLETIQLDVQVIDELYKYFTVTSFSAIRRKTFVDFLDEMIDTVLFSPHGLNETESKRIAEMQEAINKTGAGKKANPSADFRELDFAFSMAELRKELIDRGYEGIDLSELHSEMSEEEIEHHVQNKINEFNENNLKKKTSKKEKGKSKKQKESEHRQEQIEELKGKSLSVIYKSLAKIIHPDLEQDPEKKLQKEQWMKMLTVAYEQKDLKTLLEIELEWAIGEKNNSQQLTQEKLILYNEMLKAQAQELEVQAATVCTENKYALLNYFAGGAFLIPRWRAAFSVKRLEKKKMNSEIILEILEKQDGNTKKLIDKVLKDKQQEMRRDSGY